MGAAQPYIALPESDEDVWLSIADAASVLDQPERTVRAQLGKYVARHSEKVGAGGVRHEVLLTSLPLGAIARWEARRSIIPYVPPHESDLVAQAYERADQRTRKYFDRWSQALLATEGITGRKALESWADSWNREHPECDISVQSLYRIRALVREHGRIGLLMRESGCRESSVRDEWYTTFCRAYLHENRISANDARLASLGEAITQGTANGDVEFPSVGSFLRRLRAEYAPAVISFARDGEKRYFDRHGFYVERDYSSLVSGRIWVGDSRVLDVLVSMEGSTRPVRPWITAFICMKSYVPMGWYIHTSAPSAENTMRSLRHGLERSGKPDWWYLDNGREYKNTEVTGVKRGHVVNFDTQHTGSVAALLGINVHFAEAKRSRAKVIERQFLEMKLHFDKWWSTYKGGSTAEKPNRLKEVLKHPSQIPTFEEFRHDLNQWMSETFPSMVCNGKIHRGKTRAAVLLSDYTMHGPLPRISSDTASMLVTKLARLRVGRRGVTLAALKCTWWGEWMPLWKDREVVLRYDPDDLTTAKCYEATEHGSGPLISVCQLIEAAGAMVSADDAYGLSVVGEQNRIHKREIKAMKEALPQADKGEMESLRQSYRVGVGAQALEIPHGNTTIVTEHDRAIAQVRRDDRSGRADLASLVPKAKPTKKTDWIWVDDQVAAAG